MNERRRFLQVLGGGAVAAGMGCGGQTVTGFGNGSGGSGGGAASSSSTAASSSSSSSSSSTAASSSAGTGGSTGTGTTCGGGGASSEGTNHDACGSDRGVFNVGKPSDYPKDGLHMVENLESNVMIGRDAGGLYAISSLCTHSCCDLNASQQGFAYGTLTTFAGQDVIQCNCHGSMFTYDGTVVRGPAESPLQPYQLDLGCDGVLYADTTKTVATTQRLKA